MLPQASLLGGDRHDPASPALARFAAQGDIDNLRNTMANGVRRSALLLIPSAVIWRCWPSRSPAWSTSAGRSYAAATDLVSEAMFWWAFSLPFRASACSLRARCSRCSPVGHHGASRAQPAGQLPGGARAVRAARRRRRGHRHRGGHGGHVGWPGRPAARRPRAASTAPQMVAAGMRMLIARSGPRPRGVRRVVAGGRRAGPLAGGPGGVARCRILVGIGAYAAAVWALRIPEARQIVRLLRAGGRAEGHRGRDRGERPVGAAARGAIAIAFSAILVNSPLHPPRRPSTAARAVPALVLLALWEHHRYGARDSSDRWKLIAAGVLFGADLPCSGTTRSATWWARARHRPRKPAGGVSCR